MLTYWNGGVQFCLQKARLLHEVVGMVVGAWVASAGHGAVLVGWRAPKARAKGLLWGAIRRAMGGFSAR
jgi:hypothetical protein